MSATRTKLSALIITKNEAHHIRACLESLQWADEIIVVDSGSTDQTREICQELGAKVYLHDWPGFGIQKNRALQYASHEWVLSIDADERVSPELQAAIKSVLEESTPSFNAYTVARISSYCGRFIRHSGWYPDHIVRLFKRKQFTFSPDLVHERVLVDQQEPTHLLTGYLYHYSYENLEQVLLKTNLYSSLSAESLYQRGKRANLVTAILHGLWAFIRTYFLRAGFLDGTHGFMLAVSNAEASYYRYLKLMLLAKKN